MEFCYNCGTRKLAPAYGGVAESVCKRCGHPINVANVKTGKPLKKTAPVTDSKKALRVQKAWAKKHAERLVPKLRLLPETFLSTETKRVKCSVTQVPDAIAQQIKDGYGFKSLTPLKSGMVKVVFSRSHIVPWAHLKDTDDDFADLDDDPKPKSTR
jgi:hypothetical protein